LCNTDVALSALITPHRIYKIYVQFAESVFSSDYNERIKMEKFPAIGHVWRADFGAMAFDLDFQSETSMTFYASNGAPDGEKETVTYTITPLRDGQFAVRWSDKTGFVVHIEDFQQKTVHSFVTLPDGKPLLLQGSLTKIR
jgi:hypothetical protein